MSHIAPALREKFDSLPQELRNTIMEKNVNLNNVQDLMRVLEQIVAEGENSSR